MTGEGGQNSVAYFMDRPEAENQQIFFCTDDMLHVVGLCGTMRKQEQKKILTAETRFLRKTAGVCRLQNIRNDDIRQALAVAYRANVVMRGYIFL